MLELNIPEQSMFEEETGTFIDIKKTILKLEHSLSAVRKWEAKWHILFLDEYREKTLEELIDYVRCMTINEEPVDQNVYRVLTSNDLQTVVDYIKDPMTATWFHNNSRVGASNRTGEKISAEVIYYWMVIQRVPVEFENWHLNQLLTLLKVINIKSGGEKKMSPKEAAIQRAKINAERRAKYHTKG